MCIRDRCGGEPVEAVLTGVLRRPAHPQPVADCTPAAPLRLVFKADVYKRQPKTCSFACVGLGDCTKVCKFDAIHIVDGVARIDYDKCKGCGMCAQKCPKHIILFPLKDDPNPPKPVVKPAAPAAAPAAKPEAKAEAKPETKAE